MGQDLRERELREQYEAPGTAEHYATDRWQGSRRRRNSARRERRIVEELLKRTGALSRVVDLPSGTGRFTELLAQHSGNVFAMDLSQAMLKRVTPSPAASALASAKNIPLADGSVDLAFCFRLIHHFEHPHERGRVLSELHRVSKKWAVVSYFDASSVQAMRNRWRGKKETRFAQSRASFEQEVGAAGWTVEQRRYLVRGWSEQVIVLLSKKDSSEEVLSSSSTVQVVKRTLADGQVVVLKHGWYAKFWRRLEAAFRHTWWGPARVEREAENLVRLSEAGVPTVPVLHCSVIRDCLGFVRHGWLVTRFIDAPSAENHLRQVGALGEGFLDQVHASVQRIHATGCLYRGLHARNVLVTEKGPLWLDAPKAVWCKPPFSPRWQGLAESEAQALFAELNPERS